MAQYTWHVGTLAGGALTAEIPVSSGTWSTVMDDSGAMQVTVPLNDPTVAELGLYAIAEPARCFLAVAYVDDEGTETFLQGGPIWVHTYDGATQVLTIGAGGLWSYYDHRKVLPVLTVGQSAADVTTTYTALSLGTIAKRLVELAHTHAHGSVPVVLPADLAGTSERTYLGSDLSWAGAMLRNLTGVENGPEIRFTPRRKTSDPRFIEWLMEVGTDTQPLLVQVGDDWSWDKTAPKSSVVALSVQRDASGLGERAWVKGSGSGAGTLIRYADDPTLTAAGWPLTEVDETGHESVTEVATLDQWAAGALTRSARPVESWTLAVRRDDDPNVGQYLPCQWARVHVSGDPYLPGGDYRTRITGVSGDMGENVTLQLAATVGGL